MLHSSQSRHISLATNVKKSIKEEIDERECWISIKGALCENFSKIKNLSIVRFQEYFQTEYILNW